MKILSKRIGQIIALVLLTMVFAINSQAQSNRAIVGTAFQTYADAPDNAANSVTGTITVECWIKPEYLPLSVPAAQRQNQVLVSKRNSNNGGYELYINTNNQIVFATYGGGGVFRMNITTPQQLQNGNWYHVAGQYSTAGVTGIAIYSCTTGTGTVVNTAAGTSQGPVDGSSSLNLMRRASNGSGFDYFIGRLDEVRISNYFRYTAPNNVPTSYTPQQSFSIDAFTKVLYRMNEEIFLGNGDYKLIDSVVGDNPNRNATYHSFSLGGFLDGVCMF